MTATATRLRGGLRQWSSRVARAWGPELADGMRKEAPIGTPSPTQRRAPGELRESIKAQRFRPTVTGAAFDLVAPVIQARTTDKGARAHVIRARRARMLRFHWPRGPQGPGIYFFRQVNHPGNAPQDWWGPGLRRQAKPTLRKAARRVRF